MNNRKSQREYVPKSVAFVDKLYRKEYRAATIPRLTDLCLLKIYRLRRSCRGYPEVEPLVESALQMILPSDAWQRLTRISNHGPQESQYHQAALITLHSFRHGTSTLYDDDSMIVRRGWKRKALEVPVTGHHDQQLVEGVLDAGEEGDLKMVKMVVKDRRGEKKKLKIYV